MCIVCITHPLATRVGGTLYYVHQDLLGSTVALSDAAGQAMGRVQYDPYGEVITSTLPVTLTERLFTGQRLDSSTGLYYNGGGRYYDPGLAHFTSPNQYSDAPFNPQNLNRYSFRLGNPLRYAQVGERYLLDRGTGTAVADMLPPDTFTTGFGRVVAPRPPAWTGAEVQDMVTSVPVGQGVKLLKIARKLSSLELAYAMARGGFNIVRAGEYVPGSPKVLVYGNLAIRQRLGIPPTLSHGGTRAWAEYPELGRWTMGFRGTMMMSLRAGKWWIIGPAILVNAYEYSPWGPKGDIGYGTEFLAAVTVDIAMSTASTLAGAGVMALAFG
ncbi:MAG: RHS repeat-associated core domain-containing protein [Chloroflexota bacterium]|nr:RHS repeat-associated core domain-containing protein [Chloroflexota bacterium]